MLEITIARNMAATARKIEIAVVLLRTMMSANRKNLRGNSTQHFMIMRLASWLAMQRCRANRAP